MNPCVSRLCCIQHEGHFLSIPSIRALCKFMLINLTRVLGFRNSGGMLSGFRLGRFGMCIYRLDITLCCFICPCVCKTKVCINFSVLRNCSGAGICLYVDHLLEESSEEVKKLRNYMYAYKAR